ncbi:SpoIIE family protein phosphatase [Streptomyces sp. NPDC046900]|uniref:SpoIIE family protein phosphatase n=1 Tax=Streptomyces sp. NPDC046900 TaxID=3155473 RepID=UPI0033D4592B
MVGCVIVARRLCRCRGGGPGRCHGLPLPPSRGGPVLGVVPGTEYREGAFTLDEDSALVMVTDGVVEGPGLTLDAGLHQTRGTSVSIKPGTVQCLVHGCRWAPECRGRPARNRLPPHAVRGEARDDPAAARAPPR